MRRKPEFLEPKEFVGGFSGLWFYFGTYSVDGEPSYLSGDEFMRLPEEAKKNVVSEYIERTGLVLGKEATEKLRAEFMAGVKKAANHQSGYYEEAI
ncbi:hypothetical protein FOMPIDRAFT_87457 [Fomitopsis schrenkii]|uniref:DUF6697 domain-containing protein n=1 Tax=Fomitopsis schrenkii TaxID=2126942 RepID=S8DVK3_FOMSC|nr:hypothetical protein FOMPIDRAFT_87457 [Fomitopsis schrenkii]